MKLMARNFSTDMTKAYVAHAYAGNKFGSSGSSTLTANPGTTRKMPMTTSGIIPLVLLTLTAIAIGLIVSSYQHIHGKNTGQIEASLSSAAQATHQTVPPAHQAATNVQAVSTSSNTNLSSNSTTIDVNGKTVVVPANSSYSQTTPGNNGTSSVSVNASNNSSSTGSGASNNSSTTVDVKSQ